MTTERKKLDITEYLYEFVLVIIGVVLFAVCIRHISALTNLMAWDELGYWGSAAYIAGYDWSDAVSTYAGYYSYGYSLLLAILFFIFEDSASMYQAAIIMNGLFIVLSFYLSYYVGIYYAGKEKRFLVLLSSVIGGFYANNTMQSNCAWTECELIFLYWLTVVMIVSIQKNYRLYKVVVTSFLSVYLFFVHNRATGVVIALIITLGITCIRQADSVRKCMVFLGALAAVALIGIYVKGIIKENVWIETDKQTLANTMNILIPDTLRKFNLKGILEIVKTFCCRFFYGGAVTYLFFFSFIKEACCRLYYGIRNKDIDFCMFYLVLSTLGNFGLLSLTLSQQGTVQALLYGRYVDWMLGPFLVLGILLFMVKERRKTTKFLKELSIYYITFFLLYLVVKNVEITRNYFVVNCNVQLYPYLISKDTGYDLQRLMLVSVLACVAVTVCRYLYCNKKNLSYVAMICLVLIYVNSQYKVSEMAFDHSYTEYEGMQEFIDEAKEICKAEEILYFYKDDFWMMQPLVMWTQFTNYKKKVKLIDSLAAVPDGGVLFVAREREGENYYLPVIDVGKGSILEDRYLALYRIGSTDECIKETTSR